MLSYEDFCSLVKKIDKVESVTGKIYSEIQVKEDYVSFIRENKEKPELISLSQMYRFMNEQPIEYITPSLAKSYITGRVQSPAVAIIKKVYEIAQKNYKKQKLYKNIGHVTLVFVIVICLGYFGAKSTEDSLIGTTNTPCVVTADDIIVYDSEHLDKVKELLLNGDELAIRILMANGICSTITTGTKGVYIRYIEGGYAVVKFEGEIRPAIIRFSHISKQ